MDDTRLPAWCPHCTEPLTVTELVGAICQRCGCWFHHPLLEPPDIEPLLPPKEIPR